MMDVSAVNLHEKLRSILDNKIVTKLGGLVKSAPKELNRDSFKDYWLQQLSQSHRQHACCFMMQELVQLVNDVNANLLHAELIMNLVEPGSQEKE